MPTTNLDRLNTTFDYIDHRAIYLSDLLISFRHAVRHSQHYRLLAEHGYITSQQKTVNGRFNVSIYEIMIEVEALPNNSFYYPMSEKVKHDKNTLNKGNNDVMSEKLRYGITDVENSQNGSASMSEKPMSEKLTSDKSMSEKTVHSNLGHTNNNNIPYKKHGCNEQLYKDQGYNQIKEKRCGKLTLTTIKKWVNHEQHILDMEASPGIRALLGCSNGGIDDLRYMAKYKQVVEALPSAVLDVINSFDLCVQFEDHVLFEIFSYEKMRTILGRIMDNYEEITRSEAYLKTSLGNYIRSLIL